MNDAAVAWLERQPIGTYGLMVCEDGRINGRGGSTVFGHIKEDRCECKNDHHYGIFDSHVWHEDVIKGFRPAVDPHDVALKRGAPA